DVRFDTRMKTLKMSTILVTSGTTLVEPIFFPSTRSSGPSICVLPFSFGRSKCHRIMKEYKAGTVRGQDNIPLERHPRPEYTLPGGREWTRKDAHIDGVGSAS